MSTPVVKICVSAKQKLRKRGQRCAGTSECTEGISFGHEGCIAARARASTGPSASSILGPDATSRAGGSAVVKCIETV